MTLTDAGDDGTGRAGARGVLPGPGERFALSRARTAVPSLGVSRSRWPVVAWIRLRVPPPPTPPLEILAPNPVPTDPRKRVYSYEEDHGERVVRLVWDADDPELLEAECRAPYYDRRLPASDVPKFWAAVKALIAPIGPLPVEAADPRP